jgi:hypothetical protein
MFTLVAASRKPILDGIVATKTFPTLAEAETMMRNWARFGIDNQCNEADAIYICDSNKKLVRTWNRARKQSVAPD